MNVGRIHCHDCSDEKESQLLVSLSIVFKKKLQFVNICIYMAISFFFFCIN